MQILSLVAMEQPKSIDLNEIKNEKVKLLQAINEIQMEDIVLGQYEGKKNGTEDEILGYLDDSTVRQCDITWIISLFDELIFIMLSI